MMQSMSEMLPTRVRTCCSRRATRRRRPKSCGRFCVTTKARRPSFFVTAAAALPVTLKHPPLGDGPAALSGHTDDLGAVNVCESLERIRGQFDTESWTVRNDYGTILDVHSRLDEFIPEGIVLACVPLDVAADVCGYCSRK